MRTTPTIGFNVEKVSHQNINFVLWDLGGQSNIRPYWRCYFPGTNCIIFVVDSADIERLSIARKVPGSTSNPRLIFLVSQELVQMLEEEELKDSTLLVFANKQDLPGAYTAAQISEALGLAQLKDRRWQVSSLDVRTLRSVDMVFCVSRFARLWRLKVTVFRTEWTGLCRR